MPDTLLAALAFVLALGSGLVAGIFFAFSTFVMRALARLPAADGIAAMQSINIVVINPLFLGLFMGTALLGLAAGAMTLIDWQGAPSICLLAGSALYVIGSFGVTLLGNVPLNNALAKVPAESAEGRAVWARYLKDWVRWNHVRTIAALLAGAAFILALRGL
jgi:uncharacterized membrane protein